jgi:ribosomal protein S18 acetylase RimI-like enzyme
MEPILENIYCRQLQKSDKLAYRNIRLEALKSDPEAYGSSFAEESAKHELEFEKALSSGDPLNIGFGAFKDQNLIAIVCLKKEDRIKTRHRAEITSLFVQEAYRNQYIGNMIMKAILDFAFTHFPELETIRIALIQRNWSARSLYYDLGFKIYGFEKEYYKTEKGYSDMVFMSLNKKHYYKESLKV